MFKLITWQDFLAASGTLLGIYYLIIGVIYYRNEITDFFRSPQKWKNHFGKRKGLPVTYKAEDFLTEASTLKNELDQLIADAYYRKTTKEELFFGLKQHVENYGRLPDHFRIAINNHIQLRGEKIGSYHFTSEELRLLWRASE